MKPEIQHTDLKEEINASVDLNLKKDKEIWDLFRSGHEAAFVFIYRSNIQHLFHYGIRFCEDREIVKDCIQELFIDLRKSKNLKSTDCIKPYLFRALRFKVLGEIRKNNKINSITNTVPEFKFDIEVSHETKIINGQLEGEKLRKLERAISKLDNRQNEALHYFYFEGFSYSQIAKIMGFNNVKSARNLIYKAINKLRKELVQKNTVCHDNFLRA